MEPTRVQNELAAGTSSARTERSPGTAGLDRSGQAASGRAAAGSSDRIQLSSLADQILRVEGAQTAARTSRVQELGKAYAAGRYTVDPAQLSHRMVSEWLAGGTSRPV